MQEIAEVIRRQAVHAINQDAAFIGLGFRRCPLFVVMVLARSGTPWRPRCHDISPQWKYTVETTVPRYLAAMEVHRGERNGVRQTFRVADETVAMDGRWRLLNRSLISSILPLVSQGARIAILPNQQLVCWNYSAAIGPRKGRDRAAIGPR